MQWQAKPTEVRQACIQQQCPPTHTLFPWQGTCPELSSDGTAEATAVVCNHPGCNNGCMQCLDMPGCCSSPSQDLETWKGAREALLGQAEQDAASGS